MTIPGGPTPFNVPWTTVVVFVVTLIAVIVLILTGHSDFIGYVVGLPGLLAAGYAERNSRDIHNGVITKKVAEGTKQALDETGVTAVAATSGESTRLAMLALGKLLETNTAAQQTNTNAVQQSQKGGDPNGGQTV